MATPTRVASRVTHVPASVKFASVNGCISGVVANSSAANVSNGFVSGVTAMKIRWPPVLVIQRQQRWASPFPNLDGWTVTRDSPDDSSKTGAFPSEVKPTWQHTLRTTSRLRELPPAKCIACLNEVIGKALEARQVADLLENKHLDKLMERIAARSFGFSGREAYLLLASLARLPGGIVSNSASSHCLEQLCEDTPELTGSQLAHLTVLIWRATAPSQAIAVNELWVALVRELKTRLDVDFAKGDPSAPTMLRPKNVCLAAEGLSRLVVQCDGASSSIGGSVGGAAAAGRRLRGNTPLLFGLETYVASRLRDFSPPQLASLALSGACLSVRIDDILVQLRAGAKWLPPGQVAAACVAVGVSSVLRTPPPELSATAAAKATSLPSVDRPSHEDPVFQRAAEVAHFCSPGEAVQILRAFCAIGYFPNDVVFHLVGSIAKQPRTSLADADDAGLHQASLSLKLDPNASKALRSLQEKPELWDHCYQPDEAFGESPSSIDPLRGVASDSRATDESDERISSRDVVDEVAQAAARLGWHLAERDPSFFDGFYSADALFRRRDANGPGGCASATQVLPRVAVAFDIVDRDGGSTRTPSPPPWPVLAAPPLLWQFLKRTHLLLGCGVELVYIRRHQWTALDPAAQSAAVDEWLSLAGADVTTRAVGSIP